MILSALLFSVHILHDEDETFVKEDDVFTCIEQIVMLSVSPTVQACPIRKKTITP